MIGLAAVSLYFPIRSLLWHGIHGSSARVGENTVTLPPLWWQEEAGRGGSIAIRRARFGRLGTSILYFFPRAQSKTEKNEQAPQDWQHAFEAAINRGSKPTIVPLSIESQAGTLYCVRDKSAENVALLSCRAAWVPTGMGFAGLNEEESEVESILASMR
jgi:hypothetical protein